MFKKIFGVVGIAALATVMTACNDDGDDEFTGTIYVNFATEKEAQNIKYTKTSPLTMPSGTVYTNGMIKPTWQLYAEAADVSIMDNTAASQAADEMIEFEAANGFTDSHIYGGNSIGTDLMAYGAQGDLVNLTELMDAGYMPNAKAYFEENPSYLQAVTAYDGNVYHLPYIAEVGNYARMWYMRTDFVYDLFDSETTLDTDSSLFNPNYTAAYPSGTNSRYSSGGASVSPKGTTTIEKKSDVNIIEEMNKLSNPTGAQLVETLRNYIQTQYVDGNSEYTDVTDFYLSEYAAYDVDEMVALLRCVETNPVALTGKSDSTMAPLFQRKGSYRDEYLKFGALYVYGERVHGADSYGSTFALDSNGDLDYTMYNEYMYDTIDVLSDLYAEGLFYDSCLNGENTDYRVSLWSQTPAETNGQYGFMLFDFTAGATSDALDTSVQAVLPPVADINGSWQYYIDNARAIKPDGYAISAAHPDDEIQAAARIMDYVYSEEGAVIQCYGPEEMRDTGGTYKGPDGVEYPEFNQWTQDTYLYGDGVVSPNGYTGSGAGDVSTFLREWIGSLNPIGYQKSMGLEYQTTSDRGLDAWSLYNNSNVVIPSYSGVGGGLSSGGGDVNTGDADYNPYFYTMMSPVFSLTETNTTELQTTTVEDDDIDEIIYNTIMAKSGVTVYTSATDYMTKYAGYGAATYEAVYQAAYDATK